MFDAVFSMARILKPFSGFETRYQGQPAGIPVAFPGVLDRQANTPGYDPNLLAGLPVPLGSRVMIWVPLAIYNTDTTTTIQTYQYQVIWRMRSIKDFGDAFEQNTPRDQIGGYHLKVRDIGVPDDPANPTGTQRFMLPSAMQILAFEQPEPSTNPTSSGNGSIHLRGQLIIPAGAVPAGPILPPPRPATESGVSGQGIFPFVQQSENALVGGPVYFPFWFDAEGDEMIIYATRVNVTQQTQNWDFTSTDRPFSATYGSNNGQQAPVPSVGILVFTGSAP